MAKYVQQTSADDYVFFLTRKKAMTVFSLRKNDIHTHIFFWMLPSLFISPFLFYFFFFLSITYIWKELLYPFFTDQRKYNKYARLMRPKTASEVLSVIGYEVYEDELDEHIGLVNDRTPDGQKKLAEKQRKMMRPENRYRWVGIDKKIITTHMMLPGKTGAGKTETIRSISNDALKNGGGFIQNDGKSDQKMYREFQIQAKNVNRETSCLVMNFMKSEKMSESNTFSPIHIMHPSKLIEFFGALTGGGKGDGNAQYFFNNGKAMLFPVVNGVYLRDKYFNEGFNTDKIFENTDIFKMIFLNVALYGMCRDMNDRIKNAPNLYQKISKTLVVVTEPIFSEIQKVMEYVTQNPTDRDMVKEAGITYVEIKELYANSYRLMQGYMEKIWFQYGNYAPNLANVIYRMVKDSGHDFLGERGVTLPEIKKQYYYIKEIMSQQKEDELEKFQNKYKLSNMEVRTLVDSFTNERGTLESPPAEALQQHSYCQQQWITLEAVFTNFKHIFGQNKPEIKPDKLIKDNKFLYILLPPLEMLPDMVEILGKMIIMTIREVASIAIGGESLSSHKTIAEILTDKVTPKPFTFVSLDEYGAYPVEGIEIITTQVRSLNMGLCFGIQDYASMKAGGTNQTSQERGLANTMKFIMKMEDKEAIRWAADMIGERLVEQVNYDRNAHGELVAKQGINIESKKVFNPERLRDFDNGFGLLLSGSGDEGLIFVQSFYRGGKTKSVMVKRYSPFEV